MVADPPVKLDWECGECKGAVVLHKGPKIYWYRCEKCGRHYYPPGWEPK